MTNDLNALEPLDLPLRWDDPGRVARNLSPAELYEEAIRNGEAALAAHGPLVASTGEHTGRSPKDRFVVRREGSEDIDWGKVNQPISAQTFDRLLEEARGVIADRKVYVFEGYAGADSGSRIRVRVVTERAWHSLFAYNMFLRESDPSKLEGFEPDFTVVDLPTLHSDPKRDGTHSATFIMLDLERRGVLIGGTEYAGEIKKSIFSVMNYILPKQGVLSMHCSANYGVDRDDVALFFGLSGTGKTTLSSSPDRTLIGDDEHGWGDKGVFNIEGGCYAKVIRLDPEGEPEIYATTRRFGTILENVVYDPRNRQLDLNDDSLTENTRSSYPLTQLERVDLGGVAGHAQTVIFLTCDAFGVLPPISRLTAEQAMYHFLSGYTAKVAGTERGVTEPSATFSACFGAPFMPMHPGVYAAMLGDRLERHGSRVYLVNTGWTGGPFGVGKRISLGDTRRLVSAALSGELDDADTQEHPVFGLAMPQSVEGISSRLLNPSETWSDPDAYDRQAKKLAEMFEQNFRAFASSVSAEVKQAGPRV